jgi:hypothetical protein
MADAGDALLTAVDEIQKARRDTRDLRNSADIAAERSGTVPDGAGTEPERVVSDSLQSNCGRVKSVANCGRYALFN